MKEEEEQKREGDKEPLVGWNPDRDLELSSATTCSSSSNSLTQNGQHIRKTLLYPCGHPRTKAYTHLAFSSSSSSFPTHYYTLTQAHLQFRSS